MKSIGHFLQYRYKPVYLYKVTIEVWLRVTSTSTYCIWCGTGWVHTAGWESDPSTWRKVACCWMRVINPSMWPFVIVSIACIVLFKRLCRNSWYIIMRCMCMCEIRNILFIGSVYAKHIFDSKFSENWMLFGCSFGMYNGYSVYECSEKWAFTLLRVILKWHWESTNWDKSVTVWTHREKYNPETLV